MSNGNARIALLVTVVAWASAFSGTKLALSAHSPAHVALLRYVVASIALLAYALVTRMPAPRWRDLWAVAPVAAVGISGYNVLLAMGQSRVPAGTASVLIASAPIWMALLGAVLRREPVRGAAAFGIVSSFVGVALIVVGSRRGLGIDRLSLLLFAAAIAQAVYSVAQRKLVARYGAMRFVAYTVWTGTLLLLPFAHGAIDALAAAPIRSSLAIVYLGIVPGALGYAMWAYGTAEIPAAKAGSVLYLVPAVAMMIAWLTLGERPSVVSLVGGALVLGGVAVVQRTGQAASGSAAGSSSRVRTVLPASPKA